MRAITPHVLDENITGVGFGREAIVSNVDSRVRDRDPFNVQRVPSISILWQSRDVVRDRFDPDVVERDVVCAHEEIVPAWRIEKFDALDGNVGSVVSEE